MSINRDNEQRVFDFAMIVLITGSFFAGLYLGRKQIIRSFSESVSLNA
jgi:hypothetical protein